MSDQEQWSTAEERLRRVLHDEASRVQADPGALGRIRERTARAPIWRNPAVLAAAGVAAVAATVIGASVLRGPDGDDVTVSPTHGSATTSPTQTPTAAPPATGPDRTGTNEPPAVAETVPVYFLIDTPAGTRLAREFQNVLTRRTQPEAAVEAMIAGPIDPDYRTPWAADTRVNSVEVADGVIAVDLDLPDAPSLSTDDDLAIQQLVYTATAAVSDAGGDGSLPVRVLVDGVPVDALGGYDLSEPVSRQPTLDVRLLVQINDPAEGAEVGRRFTVTGEAAVFEATIVWRVLDPAATVVADGTAMTAECCRFAPFQLTVTVDQPGRYLLEVSETDPSGGEGHGIMSDTRTITVSD